ncbi:MAG: 30S ribosomal protein S15 [Candidatus Omnitrophica bacterium CG12_big_fil_rev_8_21_14_0_65_50_5]|nr:MAG: 30S ribosomal protein S15 [Candidatus Omnitrophica bacterium CG12_big_fil_rev_8_21_14_0_65_50_5]
MNNYKTSPKDTGSSVVQVAILSERITVLSEHLKSNKKDFGSRRGLLRMIGLRRRLLSFLQRKDEKRYQDTISKLNLRK